MKARKVTAFGTHHVPALDGGLPAPAINTTPLIDVMLVLLIMFIVTIPITSHKVPLDLPQGDGEQRERVVHRLDLDDAGAVSWDGRHVADAELPALLGAVRADRAADLHMRAEAATPYGRYDEVLAIVKKAGIERLGMIDNQRFAADIS